MQKEASSKLCLSDQEQTRWEARAAIIPAPGEILWPRWWSQSWDGSANNLTKTTIIYHYFSSYIYLSKFAAPKSLNPFSCLITSLQIYFLLLRCYISPSLYMLNTPMNKLSLVHLFVISLIFRIPATEPRRVKEKRDFSSLTISKGLISFIFNKYLHNNID